MKDRKWKPESTTPRLTPDVRIVVDLGEFGDHTPVSLDGATLPPEALPDIRGVLLDCAEYLGLREVLHGDEPVVLEDPTRDEAVFADVHDGAAVPTVVGVCLKEFGGLNWLLLGS